MSCEAPCIISDGAFVTRREFCTLCLIKSGRKHMETHLHHTHIPGEKVHVIARTFRESDKIVQDMRIHTCPHPSLTVVL